MATAVTALAAQILSQLGGATGADSGSLFVVIAQSLWNAAQVGTLILLLCLWRLDRQWWLIVLAGATVACLPIAIYVFSPGALAFLALLLVTCAVAWRSRVGTFNVTLVDAPASGTPMLAKFETLAFVCSLFCSMYNYNESGAYWPHWARIATAVTAATGITSEPAELTRALFTVGFSGVAVPASVPLERAVATIGGGVGVLTYVLIWTVLPFLYVLYFAACARMAATSPGMRIQQFLCLFCIFHFLFLTDLVDYEYGRGIENPAAEWAHWAERLAWRIAILLPIYQKVMSGQLKHGNGLLGVALHYALAAFAIGFAVNQLLIFDIPRFLQFTAGQAMTSHTLLGIGFKPQIGYAGALVLMTLVYGFMALAMRCKRVVVGSPGATGQTMSTGRLVSGWSGGRGKD